MLIFLVGLIVAGGFIGTQITATIVAAKAFDGP
jgi:hypothetical protein